MVLAERPTIYAASTADAPAILRLLLALSRTSQFTKGVAVDEAHLSRTLHQLLANPNAVFIVAAHDHGFCGLLVLLFYEHLLSGQRRVAQVCWYVEPAFRDGLGLALLSAGEAWATAHGAATIEMMAPTTQFGAVYERRGYVATNHVYERRA